MNKIVTIIGARPQFIKCSPVSRKLNANFNEILVHTGQHYDDNMSNVFFKELNIPKPKYNLNINGGTHSDMTASMMVKIEKVIMNEKPDLMIIYGDTNSTLAGALVAAKGQIPLAHIESGLRSFNKTMPEEINRIIADHTSDILFCPTKESMINLKNENIRKNVFLTGDVMKDAISQNISKANEEIILHKYNINRKEEYFYTTIHRQENTDNISKLQSIINILNSVKCKVIFPIHPRTTKVFSKSKFKLSRNIRVFPPVSYLDSLILQKNAKIVITDSGGVQKEAYILNTNCITLREETEWVETVHDGFNILIGTDIDRFNEAIEIFSNIENRINLNSMRYGDGNASEIIVSELKKYFAK